MSEKIFLAAQSFGIFPAISAMQNLNILKCLV